MDTRRCDACLRRGTKKQSPMFPGDELVLCVDEGECCRFAASSQGKALQEEYLKTPN